MQPFILISILVFSLIVVVALRPFFGSTFDLMDILAYAGGVLLGIFLDHVLFPRIVPSWDDISSA